MAALYQELLHMDGFNTGILWQPTRFKWRHDNASRDRSLDYPGSVVRRHRLSLSPLRWANFLTDLYK